MTTKSTLREATDKAWITAFLLSGSAAQAEAAVLKGIEWMDPDHEGEELLQCTAIAAVERDNLPGRSLKPQERALSRLPLELQRVMRLPHFLRQCFVLRVLIGMPRGLCACLLNSDAEQIDQGTFAAVQELPLIREKSFATHSGWDGSNN